MSEPVLPPKKDPKKDAEKRAEWARISAQRNAMIDAEKAKGEKRVQDEKARAAGERETFYADAAKAKADSEGREEWRQDQHRKRTEEAELRRLKALEEQRQLEAKKLRDEEEAKRTAYLNDLHKHSVEKRVAAKKAAITNETEKQVRSADDIALRDQMELDAETARAVKHAESETKKKIEAARMDSERRKKLANNKLELMAIDDALEKKTMELMEEGKHLKTEILRHSAEKKHSIQKQADRKKFDAAKRKESFEHWLETGK